MSGRERRDGDCGRQTIRQISQVWLQAAVELWNLWYAFSSEQLTELKTPANFTSLDLINNRRQTSLTRRTQICERCALSLDPF